MVSISVALDEPAPPSTVELLVPPPEELYGEDLEPAPPFGDDLDLDLDLPALDAVAEGTIPPGTEAATDSTAPGLSVRQRLSAALEAADGEDAADPVPPGELDATGEAEAEAPPAEGQASWWRRTSLPGGMRFWLGMAAGLLVFVGTTLALDRFFGPPAPTPPEPHKVVQPAGEMEAIDLEELVDQEMAKREAELRESLLEEERRLQEELDELSSSDEDR